MTQSGETEMTAAARMAGSVTNSKEKVDRIRDIIFGAQIREYTQRFDTISRELARVSQEVNRLSTQIQEQEKRLRSEIRQESDRLAAQLQEQATAHTEQIQTLDQRLSEQLQALDHKHTSNAQSLASHLAHIEQLLREELHELSQQLHHTKVDRPSLGELLIELGSSLKNNDPAPLQIATHYIDQLDEELRKADLQGEVPFSEAILNEVLLSEESSEG